MVSLRKSKQFPPWLRKRIHGAPASETNRIIADLRLNTVCESARCPNKGECYKNHTATFMILGNVCTRHCNFCAVDQGMPDDIDETEVLRICNAVDKLQLRHVVITSVTRDDLSDGGAHHFAQVVQEIKKAHPMVTIEILTPDFLGDLDALACAVKSGVTVFNHNVETVKRLYSAVRPEADYERSLSILREAKRLAPHVITKSGIMVGLGETREEVLRTIDDLRNTHCEALTIGQYLCPREGKCPVERFVIPEEFEEYKNYAEKRGFRHVNAGPFVRSSYHADQVYASLMSSVS